MLWLDLLGCVLATSHTEHLTCNHLQFLYTIGIKRRVCLVSIYMNFIVRGREAMAISHIKGTGALQYLSTRAGVSIPRGENTYRISWEQAFRSRAVARSDVQRRRVRVTKEAVGEGAVEERMDRGSVADLHHCMDKVEDLLSNLIHKVSGLRCQIGTTIALLWRMNIMMETLLDREGLAVLGPISEDEEIPEANEGMKKDVGPNTVASSAGMGVAKDVGGAEEVGPDSRVLEFCEKVGSGGGGGDGAEDMGIDSAKLED